MKTIALSLLLAVAPLFAEEPPYDPKNYNVTCPTPKGCEALLPLMEGCKKNASGACGRFVQVYKNLTQEFDCQREAERAAKVSATVPAIWLCGTIQDRAVDFLSKLDTPRARAFYRSSQLQSTLDGSLAEQYGLPTKKNQKK